MVYNQPHRFYVGVDLHARSLFTHVLDHQGQTDFERDLLTDPGVFLDAIAPFRPDLVVGAECMFSWYWLADLCADELISQEQKPTRPSATPDPHRPTPGRAEGARPDRRSQRLLRTESTGLDFGPLIDGVVLRPASTTPPSEREPRLLAA